LRGNEGVEGGEAGESENIPGALRLPLSDVELASRWVMEGVGMGFGKVKPWLMCCWLSIAACRLSREQGGRERRRSKEWRRGRAGKDGEREGKKKERRKKRRKER